MMNNKGFRKIILGIMAGALALSAAAAVFSGCNNSSPDKHERPQPTNERPVENTEETGE